MTGERKRRDGETQRDIYRVAAALVSRHVLSQGLYKRGSNDKRFMCEKEDFLWEKTVTLLSYLSSHLRSRRRRRKRVEIERVQSNAGKRELPKFASSPARLKESLCLSASVFKVVHQVLMNRRSWSERTEIIRVSPASPSWDEHVSRERCFFFTSSESEHFSLVIIWFHFEC